MPPKTGEDDARPRGRGRPRSPEVDEGILRAALEVVAESGYKLATLESIAARAGVGTATIYRRYQTKKELVSAALRRMAEQFHAPDTGDVRQDLAILVHELATGLRPASVGRVLAAMSFTDPDLLEVGRTALARPRRAVLTEVVRQGINAGQLRKDLDVDVFVDVLSALPIWAEVIRAGRGLSLKRARTIIDLLITGAAP